MSKELFELLYKELPSEYVRINLMKDGEAGEKLAVDEACVWKRILDYRLISYLRPQRILETHSGLGVASDLYRIASSKSEIISCKHFQDDIPKSVIFDYIDIDPYGQPYEALEYTKDVSDADTVWQITNGEIMQVSRGLKGVKLESPYKGKECYKWVEEIYIPYIEEYLNSAVQFYYIFPTSVRLIVSNRELPKELFKGCPKYMSWISKYARRKLF